MRSGIGNSPLDPIFVSSSFSGTQPSASSQSVTPATDALFPVVSRGSASIATAQVAVPANTATLVAAARTGRQKVTVSPTTSRALIERSAGVSNTTGLFVPAGGSKTTDTAAAIYVYSPTAITVSVEELY